jgi:hypothetical protein
VIFMFVFLIIFVMLMFQKINTKNAFNLQLIDYMAMMLKKQDSKMDNFQVKQSSHLALCLFICSHVGPTTVIYVVYMSLRHIVISLSLSLFFFCIELRSIIRYVKIKLTVIIIHSFFHYPSKCVILHKICIHCSFILM